MDREQEFLNQLEELVSRFNGLEVDKLNEKNIGEVREIIANLTQIRRGASELNDEVMRYQQAGEYYPDEINNFYRSYIDFGGEIERAFIDAGRRQSFLTTAFRELVDQHRRVQVEVVRIEADIREREEQLSRDLDRTTEIENELNYLDTLDNNINIYIERAADNGRLTEEVRRSLERDLENNRTRRTALNSELRLIQSQDAELRAEVAVLRVRLQTAQNRSQELSTKMDNFRENPNENIPQNEQEEEEVDRDRDNSYTDSESSSIDSEPSAETPEPQEYETVSVTEKWIRKNSDGESVDDEFPELHEGEEYKIDIIDTDGVYDLYRVTVRKKIPSVTKEQEPQKEPTRAPIPPRPINRNSTDEFNVVFDLNGGRLNPGVKLSFVIRNTMTISYYPEIMKVFDSKPYLDDEHEFVEWEANVDGFGVSTPVEQDIILRAKYRVRKHGISDSTPPTPPIPEQIDIDKDFGSLERFIAEENKDMLDKFWGNREKHKEFEKRIARIHSHIVEKDGYQTIEEYDLLEEDLRFCRIEEYKERLERYTTPDNAAYIKLYNDMLKVEPELIPEKSGGVKISLEEFIKICQADDELYLSTNNQNYDKHKATAENIKTLGKHAERMEYLTLEKVAKLEGSEKAKAILSNLGKVAANVGYFIRNHTKVPIDKFIGTYIAAPIHKVITRSRYSSPYKDDLTHRIGERRQYFEAIFDEEYERKYQERAERRRAAGKTVRKPSVIGKGITKAFGPRFKAIFNCREGNIQVLASKANENAKNAKDLLARKTKFKVAYAEAGKAKEKFLAEINEVNEKLDGDITLEEKEELETKRDELIEAIEGCDRAMEYYSGTPGRKQNDAISMETHYLMNKENITKATTAAKIIAKALLMRLVIPKIVQKIYTDNVVKEVIPGHTVVVHEEGLNPDGLKNLTLDDIYKAVGDQEELTYDAYNIVPKTHPMVDNPIARGFAVKYKGHTYSISDIDKVINGHQLTTTGNYPVTNDMKFFDIMAQTISRGGGPKVTADDLVNEIMNSSNSEETLLEMLSGSHIWTSDITTGISRGWLNTAKAFEVLSKMPYDITKEVPEEVITTIIPVVEEIVSPGHAILAGLIGASAMDDIYDLARRTKSDTEIKAEILRRASKEIEARIDEYPEGPEKDAARAAYEYKIEEEAKELASIYSKPGRDYEHADFTNRYNFTGTRKDPKVGPYNENDFENEPDSSRGR